MLLCNFFNLLNTKLKNIAGVFIIKKKKLLLQAQIEKLWLRRNTKKSQEISV